MLLVGQSDPVPVLTDEEGAILDVACVGACEGDPDCEALCVDSSLAEEPTGPDRSGPPEVLPPEILSLPEPTRHELHPGLSVDVVEAPWARKLELQISFHRGRLFLGDGQQTEEARMMGWLWDVATLELDGSALSEIKDLHEIEIWSTSDANSVDLVLRVPAEHLSLGLDLLNQVIHEPAFPRKELKLAQRDRKLRYTVEVPVSLGALASEVLDDAWYPADHPYGARTDLKALKKTRSSDLRALHSTLLENAPVSVTAVGPVPWAELEEPLRAALGAIGVSGERPEPYEDPAHQGTRVFAVDLPGQEQVAVRLRLSAPGRYHTDRPAFSAVNFALTGTFLSRLNKNLREEKGWTYGVRGGYSVSRLSGQVLYSVDVPLDKARAAMDELEKELAKMAAEGPTQDEIDNRWRDQVSTWNTRLQTSEMARSFYAGLVDYQESLQDRLALLKASAELSPEQCQQAANRYLGSDAPRLWVVVGDRAGLEPQLEGYEVTWLDPESAALGSW